MSTLMPTKRREGRDRLAIRLRPTGLYAVRRQLRFSDVARIDATVRSRSSSILPAL